MPATLPSQRRLPDRRHPARRRYARPFVAIVSAERSGIIHSHLQTQDRGMPLFRFTDFRAACVAAAVIQAKARHARTGFSLLVPGVPEADSDDEALAALIRWHDWVAADLRRRLPASRYTDLRRAA